MVGFIYLFIYFFFFVTVYFHVVIDQGILLRVINIDLLLNALMTSAMILLFLHQWRQRLFVYLFIKILFCVPGTQYNFQIMHHLHEISCLGAWIESLIAGYNPIMASSCFIFLPYTYTFWLSTFIWVCVHLLSRCLGVWAPFWHQQHDGDGVRDSLDKNHMYEDIYAVPSQPLEWLSACRCWAKSVSRLHWEVLDERVGVMYE